MDIYVIDNEHRIKSSTHISTSYSNIEVFCRSMGLDVHPPRSSHLIAIMHQNNDEATYPTPWEPRPYGWSDGMTILSYTAMRVCQAKGRVIVFSGGGEPVMTNLENLLKSNGYYMGVHFAFVPFDSIYLENPDIVELPSVSPDWHIDRLDKRKIGVSPEIMALKILLLGYLAACKPERIFDKTFINYIANKIKDEKKPCLIASDNLAMPIRKSGEGDESFWYDPLIGYKDKDFSYLARGSKKWETAEKMKEAWEIIWNSDRQKHKTPDEIADIFYAAHKEFKKKAMNEDRNKAFEFEKLREILNHDEVKNKFINKIASARSDTEISLRAKNIKEVWDVLRDGISVEDLSAKERTVRQGLENWKSVYASLRHYFETTVKEYGFKGTGKFEEVKRDFFEDDNSKTGIISRFVADFDKIALSSDMEREERLKEFFNAIDAIHTTLSDMRYGDPISSHFYEYFQEE